MIKLFYDVETTGVDYRKHCIHQLSGLIEVDDVVVESFNLYIAPHEKAQIDPKALEICKVTEEAIRGYPGIQTQHKTFTRILSKYIDRYDKFDKAYLIGFNNLKFDNEFLRMFFALCNDAYFGSWFWSDSIDVLALASQYLISKRKYMPNFKLQSVAEALGIDVEDEDLHDAMYDVKLTRDIYKIITSYDIQDILDNTKA